MTLNELFKNTMGVGSLGKVSLFSYDGDKPFVTDSTLRIYRAKKHTHVLPEVLCIFLQSAIGTVKWKCQEMCSRETPKI